LLSFIPPRSFLSFISLSAADSWPTSSFERTSMLLESSPEATVRATFTAWRIGPTMPREMNQALNMLSTPPMTPSATIALPASVAASIARSPFDRIRLE
jgi:hypothetical protein